jgi:hypothetical protein
MAPLHLLFGSLEASVDFWMFGFCFVQFREYFPCNFSETQKQQKIGNWHCGDLLIGYFWKMHKSATKCNETLGKWCKNKHGASKIIDILETYQRATDAGRSSWQQDFNSSCSLNLWGGCTRRGERRRMTGGVDLEADQDRIIHICLCSLHSYLTFDKGQVQLTNCSWRFMMANAAIQIVWNLCRGFILPTPSIYLSFGHIPA